MNRTRQAQPRAPAEDGRGGKGAALSERTQAYENRVARETALKPNATSQAKETEVSSRSYVAEKEREGIPAGQRRCTCSFGSPADHNMFCDSI